MSDVEGGEDGIGRGREEKGEGRERRGQ